jgi:hypothetical protein
VAVALLVGGIAILVIERLAHEPRFHDTAEVPPATALGIGLCQTVSMIPGVSRAGATIMGGVLLGLDRKAAAEFSFFLAIPTMLGASVLDLYKGWDRLAGPRHRRGVARRVRHRDRRGARVRDLPGPAHLRAVRLVPDRRRTRDAGLSLRLNPLRPASA